MKTFLTVFFFLLYSIANCQSLSLFDIDASNFPNIRAKFYAFDAQGNQQRPYISDLSLSENGITQTINYISCPAPKPPKPLSSVLVIDISGSMDSKIAMDKNIDIAKAGANTWVDLLPVGSSECAVVSFDNENYLNQDFTTDKNKLNTAITKLSPSASTDYNAAFINEKAGGLLISKKGKYQKVIVFLTDGQAEEPDKQQIINEAKNQNCIIYCVTLGIFAPQSIKDIATETGGRYFENIRSVSEAKNIYNTILRIAQENEPCDIEWNSQISCVTNLFNVNLSYQTTSTFTTYTIPHSKIAKLEISPFFTRFENPIIGSTETKEITVTAKNAAFTVSNITSSNPDFIITPTSFSLQPNQSQTLFISHTAKDSTYQYTKFTFQTNICSQTYYASSLFSGAKQTVKTLKLLQPNGGESYVIGSDTIITWEGIAESELVRLDYSIDKGQNWKFIDTSRGSSYKWTNIPKPESIECIVKVTQITHLSNDSDFTFIGHQSSVQDAKFSADDSKIISVSWDRTIRIWDIKTKLQILGKSSVHNLNVYDLAVSPNGKTIATCSWDDKVKIWDVNTLQEIFNLQSHKSDIIALAYSNDGNMLVSGDRDGKVILWDPNTGQEIQTILQLTKEIRGLSFSPDGEILAVGSENSRITLVDVSTGNIIRFISCNTFSPRPTFSRDGTMLSVGAYNKIQIFDVATGQLMKELFGHYTNVFKTDFSPDGKLLISGGEDKTLRMYDVNSGNMIRTITDHKGYVNSVKFNSDGNSFVSASLDNTVKLWIIGGDTIQSDQSDSVFSIVEPMGASTDIAMGEVLVGDDKDSVVVDFVRNVGSWNFDVRSVSFRGADASAFSLVSGIPQYRVEPNSSHFGEFRFTPSRVGLHQAEVVIVTQSDTIVQTITGVGVENQLQIHATFIDFGEVEVGNERTIIDTLVLKNVGSNAITIEDTKLLSPDMEQFAILSGGGNFTLGAGEERLVTAQFKPKYIGRTSGRIGFEYTGVGSPAIAHLFGNGIGGLVYVPNDSGYVGDRKSIPLMLGNVKTEAIASIAPKFKAMLRIQNNLLAPISKANTFIQNDSMYFTVQGAVGITSELAQIPIVVGLGNVDFSWIDIAEFTFLDASDNPVYYDFEKQHGSFKILGICQEGGARLIHSSTPLPLLMVSPNPSDGKATIELNLIEDGVSSLKIYNSNGFLMESYGFTTSGSRTIEVDTKNYSNGLYFITIETPTLFDKAKLMLVR